MTCDVHHTHTDVTNDVAMLWLQWTNERTDGQTDSERTDRELIDRKANDDWKGRQTTNERTNEGSKDDYINQRTDRPTRQRRLNDLVRIEQILKVIFSSLQFYIQDNHHKQRICQYLKINMPWRNFPDV